MVPISDERQVRIDDRIWIRWGRILAGTLVALGLISLGISVISGGENFYSTGVLQLGLWSIGLGSLVWVTISTQARNGVIWALAWAGFFAALNAAGFAVFRLTAPASVLELSFEEALALSPSDLPVAPALGLNVYVWSWIPAFFLVLTLGLLLFPDGRPPSPRWRPVSWVSVGGIVFAVASTAWDYRPSATIPFDAPIEGTEGPVSFLIFGLVLVAVMASISSLFVRYRRSSGVTRHQIRWIIWAGAFLAGSMFLLLFEQETTAVEFSELSALLLLSAAEVVLILSFAVAITRYRLYDIDVVISKTVVYALLAIFISAVYVVVVVGIGQLLGQGGDASFGLSVAATALVAMAFQPVRRQVEQWANRLVYGERASPYEVLASFSHRAVEVDEAEFIERVPRLIVDGTGASAATLWVRDGELFVASGTWPQTDEVQQLEMADETFEDPGADHSLPIYHDDELLGAISLTWARGETITPSEAELLDNLSSAMGLSLRNARLTKRLQEQVVSLEASRERILAAADEARRALELDLDSGPQQQLVALKVMLGPTRLQAEKAGATRTSEVLAQLEKDAGDAIRSVRDFATGVYPPLLAAEGLGPAIALSIRNTPIPVILDANGITRQPADVEAAVYFCILEAIQNVAKYAQATSIRVTLAERDGELAFEVIDDGRGFEDSEVEAGAGLANMADRMDAVGGQLNVESSVGQGTSVRGSVPVRQVARVDV
jgi:signal transduction histidine kinase